MYPSLRWISITATLVVTGLSLLYFGTSLSLSYLSGSVYISVIVVGGCEFLSNILCGVFIHKLPRKKGLVIFYSLRTLIALSFVFFKYTPDGSGVPEV